MHKGAQQRGSELGMPFCVGVLFFFVLKNFFSNSLCKGVGPGGGLREYTHLCAHKCLMSTVY